MNTTLQIRIDKKTKDQAQKVFKKVGIDMSSGIKMFLKKVVNTKSIPFVVTTENGYTPEFEQRILAQLKDAEKNGKRYKTIKEAHIDILK